MYKKQAQAKLSFCFKEKIRQTKIGKIREKFNDGWWRGVVNIHIYIYIVNCQKLYVIAS